MSIRLFAPPGSGPGCAAATKGGGTGKRAARSGGRNRGAVLGPGRAGADAGVVALHADGDVDGGPHRGAGGHGVVHGVGQERGKQLLVLRHAGVDGRVRLLLQHVVEARRPLARAQAGGVRAVVHHEGDAARVHVGVQAVHRLDDGLIADLAVAVALLLEARERGHHVGDVDTGGEGVQRDVGLHARGAHLRIPPAFRYDPNSPASSAPPRTWQLGGCQHGKCQQDGGGAAPSCRSATWASCRSCPWGSGQSGCRR
mmetsp:Transcript_25254/g.63640  ORF Transcript_25254/g.63640 Transcript_25254/m.63640 type:complete len:256 (+) Transcript_25254:75-842(+)